MEHFNLEPHPGIMKTAVDIVCPLYLQLHIPRFSQPRIQQYILIGKKKKNPSIQEVNSSNCCCSKVSWTLGALPGLAMQPAHTVDPGFKGTE